MTLYQPILCTTLLAAVVALFSGCEQTPQEPTPRPLPTEDDYDIEHVDDALDSKRSEFVKSYKYYEEFAKAIAGCTKVELYEGLPHPLWENESYKAEKENTETINLNGSYFYAVPIEMTESDAERLKYLYCRKESFVPFRGWKGCGGYHPDWCIRWSDGTDEHLVEFCFGCGEMTTYNEGNTLHCDIWDISHFQGILKHYQKLRPPYKSD